MCVALPGNALPKTKGTQNKLCSEIFFFSLRNKSANFNGIFFEQFFCRKWLTYACGIPWKCTTKGKRDPKPGLFACRELIVYFRQIFFSKLAAVEGQTQFKLLKAAGTPAKWMKPGQSCILISVCFSVGVCRCKCLFISHLKNF